MPGRACDCGRSDRANPRCETAQCQKPVHQRPARVTERGMHDETRAACRPLRRRHRRAGRRSRPRVGLRSVRAAAAGRTTMLRPACRRCRPPSTAPSTVTRPLSIQRCSSERDDLPRRGASRRSGRAGALGSGGTTSSIALGRAHQSFDLICPLALMRMSTSARS